MKEKEYKNLISCGWNAKYKENLKRSMKKKKNQNSTFPTTECKTGMDHQLYVSIVTFT